MANERCPSCGGAVRAGDPWCTLCWTDLRPKPVPPALPEIPVGAAPLAASPEARLLAAPPGPAVATVDPLTAPLPVVLGDAPAPEAGAAVTWPCVECGAHTSIDLDSCATCAAPFGGRIARLDDPKGQRRRVMFYALGAVGVFLLLLATITFASTNASTTGGGGDAQLEQPIDWDSIPRE